MVHRLLAVGSLSLLLAAGVVAVGMGPAAAAPGDLDPSFDGDGIVTTAAGGGGQINAIAIQPDGKIVAVGQSFSSNFDIAVNRYTPTGGLDPTFDGDGKVITAVGTGDDVASAAALQPDGKIVVAGRTFNGSNDDAVVVRYLPSGALDTSFDGDGVVSATIGSGNDAATGIVVQPDGKIVIAGSSSNGANSDFFLARFTSSGLLDGTFGLGGKKTTPIGSGNDSATALALLSDSRLVVAGHSTNTVTGNEEIAIARYTSSGNFDPSFDTDGKVLTLIGAGDSLANAMTVQWDGKIVVAGEVDTNFTVSRFTPSGALDPTFSGDGVAVTPAGTGFNGARAVAIQPDDKIVAAGWTGPLPNKFALIRYTAAGKLDPSFGGDGIVLTAIGSTNDIASALAIQPDGKIIAGGFSQSPTQQFALARYQVEPPALSVADASITEGDAGTSDLSFVITLDSAFGESVSVSYSTSADTATGADFVPKSGTLTFAPGQVTKTVTVAVKGDDIDEPDERLDFALTAPAGASIADGQATGTIMDNDSTPEISVEDAVVTEGTGGSTNMVFKVSLSNPSSAYVVVDYTTSDGSATAPADYQARSGTKVFQPGQAQKSISVPVTGDAVQEPTETFFLNLLDPDNADLARGQGLGTITDDDAPTISISNAQVTETNSGTNRTMTFTVTLNHAASGTVTVAYATANGTAVAPADYTAKSGTVTFTAGVVTQTVKVTVKGDNTNEPDETFVLNLSSPTNATIADGQGVGLIVDND